MPAGATRRLEASRTLPTKLAAPEHYTQPKMALLDGIVQSLAQTKQMEILVYLYSARARPLRFLGVQLQVAA